METVFSAVVFATITDALCVVHGLRAQHALDPQLCAVLHCVKRVQSQRFSSSYADVLQHRDWGFAAQFFLDELYADKDFSARDTQFERIAPRIERFFPKSVNNVALTLARLHALSEQLDDAMARQLLVQLQSHTDFTTKTVADCVISTDFLDTFCQNNYVAAWRRVAQRPARESQLALALQLGHELTKITQIAGLGTMLRMMRGPAGAAGLRHLQLFLERGFVTFATMQRSASGASGFLATVQEREAQWIALLFNAAASPLTHSDDDSTH